MPFRLNPIYGTLDLVGSSSSGSGNVTGIAPTDIRAIARWNDTSGTTIENSPGTLVQDSGAIEAQGFITNRIVTGTVVVNTNESWISPSLVIQPGGMILLSPDSELILI